MRTIAFVTQKGGTGKSTLASNVSVAARLAGERVFIIDLDPLQSLVKWSKTREKSDIAVEHVPPAKLGKALAALEKKGITLVVIDAPGLDGEYFSAAVGAADLCIIPTRPNVFDLWASDVTRAALKDASKDYVFLLNQCPPAQQNSRVEQGAKALQAMGGLLAPLVSARVDYQEAARLGLGVGEYHPGGAAADEIRELWGSVKRRLKKGASAAKPAKSGEKSDAKPGAKDEAKSEVIKVAVKRAAKIAAKIASTSDAKLAGASEVESEARVETVPAAAATDAKAAVRPARKAA